MCCFSNEVSYVGETRIFVRGLDDGSQFVVYSMAYEAASDLAMILPLPTPPRAEENAVSFIDLSDYPEFFDDLHSGIEWSRSATFSATFELEPKTLEIHDVGSFEASFVPHQDDFGA
ncbi:MAG: hypothetical protein GY759_14215 [Chloroflexi bacterium]|nr:hypothetical protein [Chloroflexota bacterium]